MIRNQKVIMDIEKEIASIGVVVQKFETDLRQHLNRSIAKAIEDNPTMTITIEPDHIVISDYIDGEQVDYLVYIEPDITLIEATKQGFSIGYLEPENETYIKFRQILSPIEETYRSFFSWDGKDFVINLK